MGDDRDRISGTSVTSRKSGEDTGGSEEVEDTASFVSVTFQSSLITAAKRVFERVITRDHEKWVTDDPVVCVQIEPFEDGTGGKSVFILANGVAVVKDSQVVSLVPINRNPVSDRVFSALQSVIYDNVFRTFSVHILNQFTANHRVSVSPTTFYWNEVAVSTKPQQITVQKQMTKFVQTMRLPGDDFAPIDRANHVFGMFSAKRAFLQYAEEGGDEEGSDKDLNSDAGGDDAW